MRPRHRTCFAVDISRFASRDVTSQAYMRKAVGDIAKSASAATGVRWRSEKNIDRGDGLLVVTGKVGVEVLFRDFIRKLCGEVRGYNLLAAHPAKMQLRLALDAGYLVKDAKGYSGTALNRVSRMLDAPEFKARMSARKAEFAVITSNELHEVADGYHLLEGWRLEKVPVNVKETHTDAWMWIP
ncbi:hypothetical protein [Actinomadura terrae]|uniref:hypothetical protein n=1 Tax=Actinomadura terrae TaxID=604353 RepID=UPI001FA7938B|nr:hypothetical protein [Actinomadura terrae]